MEESRWDRLAADLDGEATALESAETYAQAADVARAERASVTLADRLRAAVGREVTVCVRGAGPLRGALTEVGRDWVLVADGARETAVQLVAVLSVTGVGPGAVDAASASAVARGLGIGHVLRRHARDRSVVRVVLDSGDTFTGTVDVVGADHLELAEHAADERRRAVAVVARRLVPFRALATVARLPG